MPRQKRRFGWIFSKNKMRVIPRLRSAFEVPRRLTAAAGPLRKPFPGNDGNYDHVVQFPGCQERKNTSLIDSLILQFRSAAMVQ